jgi:hypothetical protein
MLTLLPQKFLIQPIVDQVVSFGDFGKRIDLNSPSGKFFNDPWIVKPEFKDTPLGNVLDSLGSIGQARLLCLDSSESYTAHYDPDDRIHLAVITNPHSFLVNITENKLYHLPADGQLWFMDTGKMHVAANWGARTRIHLNIRVLLPKFDRSKEGVHIKIKDGDFDWKQESYIEIMGTINRLIKSREITGFESSDPRELFLNCKNYNTFIDIVNRIRSKGVDIDIITF